MFLKFILSLFLITNVSSSTILSNKCDYNTKETCINDWSCMWCNKTLNNITNSTNPYKNSSTISECNVIATCNFNDKKSNCLYSNDYKYNLHCTVIEVFFYTMIFMGYYFSMIVIYGIVNRLLLNDNVSNHTRNTINSIILLILSVPLILYMFLDKLIFYTLFLCYVFIALFSYCCIKIKDKDRNLHLVKQPPAPPYSAIN